MTNEAKDPGGFRFHIRRNDTHATCAVYNDWDYAVHFAYGWNLKADSESRQVYIVDNHHKLKFTVREAVR